jgi:hypothetical protein
MAKPVCTQTMITMRRNVLSGRDRIQLGGSASPTRRASWLSRPT